MSGEFRVADLLWDTQTTHWQIGNLVGLTVYADDARNRFSIGIHKVNNTPHVAVVLQRRFVRLGKGMSLVFLFQIGFLADEMGNETHATVFILPEGQTGCGLQLFITESRMHGDEIALTVVNHLG